MKGKSIPVSYNSNSVEYRRIILGNTNIFKCLLAYIIIFLAFFIYYSINNPSHQVETYFIFLQIIYFISFSSVLILTYKYRVSQGLLYFLTFIYSLILGYVVRETAWISIDAPYFNDADSLSYDNGSTMAIMEDKSLSQYLSGVKNIDDWGMCFFVYGAYKLFGIGIPGQNALIWINAIFITISTYWIYGILTYFSIKDIIKRFSTSFFAFFPFFSMTAGDGLKENFFVFFIVGSFYFIFLYKKYKLLSYLLLSFICLAGTFLFRIATFAMVLLAMLTILISGNSNKKLIGNLLIYGVFFGMFLLGWIVDILYGADIEKIMTIANDNPTSDIGNGNQRFILQILANFFGPFSNFSNSNAHAIIYSSGVLMKGILGFPMIYCIYKSIKSLDWKYYGLILYFAMNVTMIVIVERSLDMRYQVTAFPMIIPLIANGLEVSKMSKYFGLYIVLLISLTFLYNQR